MVFPSFKKNQESHTFTKILIANSLYDSKIKLDVIWLFLTPCLCLFNLLRLSSNQLGEQVEQNPSVYQ